MKTDHLYRALRTAIVFLTGVFVMACAEKEIEKPDPNPNPDPTPTTEQIETQLEKDRTDIVKLVSSCITDDFNAETLVKEKLESIKTLPSVKSVEVTSAGVHLKYVDDTEECFLFDYGTAFDDETTQANSLSYSPPTLNPSLGTKASESKTIHFFNLFSNDSGRKNQNQLMKSAAEQLANIAQIVEHPFSDFTVNSLVSALEDPNCTAIFISTIGDEYGNIAVGGDYYKKYDGYSMPSGGAGEFYTPLTPVGNNQIGNVVNQITGHTYRGASLHYFLKNINSSKLAGKMVYLSSCHTLHADFGNYNVCLVGWDNVNKLGEAYALIMADYLGNYYLTLSSFLEDLKNSASGIEDKYTNCGAMLRVKGAIKDFTFFRKELCTSKPKREGLKPHKIQITSPDNGGCVNPFAIYSAGIGGNALVYFDYLLDTGETVSLFHNTAPQGRVYFTRTNDFLKHDLYSSPKGMYQQKSLNPYAVVSFYDPGVMRVSFYSQDKSDYKEKGPDHYSHKLEDEIYIIAPRNYKKNDPVQNTDPAVTTLTVLKSDNSMIAYGGAVNMESESLKKGFRLSNKGEDVNQGIEVPASNDGNLFYAPMPNMKKGAEYTVMAYATDENGTLYKGEPYDFISEVETAIPTEPTPGDLIDLGLSVKWASCNIGATEPQDIGGFYAWGETQTKSTYSWSNYSLCRGSETTLTKYCTQSSYGTVDSKTVLDSADDVAYSTSGGKLRMPTSAEWQELIDHCLWTKIQYKDRDGYLVASPVTGNAIFIPCNGFKTQSNYYNFYAPYYWSSDLSAASSKDAIKMDYVVSCELDGHQRFEGLGVRPVANLNVTNVPETETITVYGVSFKMVKVEGGTFMMGSTEDDPDAGGIYSDETPQHRVTLSTYAIGETEVTQALWKAVMGSNPSRIVGDELPVEEVSWEEATSFVKKLSSLTGRSFRLPTEAEWEYAARGGKYSKGYRYSGSDNVHEISWNCDNSDWTTHSVATKKPNELGLYDMSGNVWEWCQDWYDFNYYKDSPSENPCNTEESDYHIHRGGSFEYILTDLRVAMRGDYINPPSNSMRGLRLVLSSLSPGSTARYVDLGLPSGTLWATCNVGAAKPEEFGDYFAWGEVSPKDSYTSSNYTSAANQISTYFIAGTEYDAATVVLGSDWRMPTNSEMQELHDHCALDSYEEGLRVIGPNGNSILIPMSGFVQDGKLRYKDEYGFIWVSDRYYGSSWWWSNQHSDDESPDEWPERYAGLCIRPVYVGFSPSSSSSRRSHSNERKTNPKKSTGSGGPSRIGAVESR